MKYLFVLASFVLNALLLAGAQQAAPATSASSISGTVVREPGSQPLKKVLVQIVAENQKDGGNYTASTDADGHFHVENVAPGRYRLFLEKTGLVGVNERGLKSDTNVFTVRAGQSVNDLLLRMLATAVISGRITDEDGDPMSGVRVVALKKVPGKARKEALGTEATNDLGEYRLAGLFPGQYWIVAMPAPDFRDYEQYDHERQEKPQSNDSGNDNEGAATTDTRYLTTYYPGTYDAAQASSLTLKAGDEMPVNLTLVPARTYRIRGIVTGVPSGQKPVVELFSKAGDSIHASEVQSDGQFEVRGLGPGSYVLQASSASDSLPLTARQDVTVVAGDVDGLKLAPQRAFIISGHLRVEGGIPETLTQFSVNLRSTELPENPGFFMSPEFFGTNAPVDRLGNFQWKQVNPGNYIVRLFGGDGQNSFYLKSVKLGEREIETGFVANGPTSLDVLVSLKAATIEGSVIEKDKENDAENSHPVANATVVAVPEEKYRKLSDRFGTGESDQNGRFIIRGLAPGDYTLYAWQDVDENVYRDPDFLKSQEANGTAVKVDEGSHVTVELKPSAAGDEWH